MDFDTRQVRAFLTLARELHFTRAARRMYLTQPTMSRYIRRMEEQIGSPLFERTSRDVRLTAAGRRFQLQAQNLIDLVDGIGGPPAGLRLASMGQVGLPPELVTRIRAARPSMPISLATMSGVQQLAAVRAGDLSVGWVRLAAMPGPELVSELVRLEPLYLGWPHADTVPLPRAVARFLVTEADTPPWAEYIRDLAAHVGVDLTVNSIRPPVSSIANLTALAPPGGTFVTFETVLPDVRAVGVLPCAMLPVQPYYPWSLVWRAGEQTEEIDVLREVARELGGQRGWLDADPRLPGEPWMPRTDPHRPVLERLREGWRRARTESADAGVDERVDADGPVLRLEASR